MLVRHDEAQGYTDFHLTPSTPAATTARTAPDPTAKMEMQRTPSLTMARGEPGEIEESSTDTIPDTITGANPVITLNTTGRGFVSGPSDVDLFRMDVVAGETYLIDLRGAPGAGAIGDPLLKLFNSQGGTIGFDDDGGRVYAALYTYTATYTGPLYLGATAYWDSGAYEMRVARRGADEDASSLPEITPGTTTYGFLTNGDSDLYAVYLEAGRYYQFEVSGGADYNNENGTIHPGELDTFVTLFDSSGKQLAANDDEDSESGDFGSALGYLVETSGYYHLSVDAEGAQNGGYTVDVTKYNLAEENPLDSIDWGSQVADPQNISVYFAKAGEAFGGDTSLGWTSYEIQQTMLAFQQYENIANLRVSITDKPDGATFKMVTIKDSEAKFTGKMHPPGTTDAGIGTFNLASAWDRNGPSLPDPYNGSLEQGGFGFHVLLHEIGHGLGLAHPHDEGGTSSIMLGIYGGSDSYGVYDLNQGVYTTMSYNSGWELNPLSPTTGFSIGFERTPGALDIALLQQKYGAVSRNDGNDTYYLQTANVSGTSYATIWDTGGTDTIVNDSAANAIIDLTAATIDYSRTGAGAISNVSGVKGGFTIARGVVVENATGGGGNDTIVGNAAANFVDLRRGGDDWASGGAGNDAFYLGAAMTSADRVNGGADQDQIGLQGNYASLMLGPGSVVGVETVALLSGTDTRFGDAGAGVATRYNYAISTSDAIVAAGERLIVQAGQLVAGESLAFNGAEETDGTFLTYGGRGQDMIIGGQLSDGFYFGDGAFSSGDRVVGSGGNNDQLGLRGDYSAGLIFAADAMEGVETLVFLSGADVRFGTAGSGYSYNVTLNDANIAAGTSFTVNGAVLGDSEKLILDASKESDGSLRILGGKSSDSLTAGAGSDILYGGLGADTLSGGEGKDSFIYRSVDESTTAAPDRILLFQAGDVIDLTAIDANSTTAENDTFVFIGSAAFSGVAGQLRTYLEGDYCMVACDTGGDGVADFLISLTTAVEGHLLGADDFLF